MELTIDYIIHKLNQPKVHLLAYTLGPDHVHLFVSNVRWVGEIELVRQIKVYSSYMMRKGHSYMFEEKLWGDNFWSEGHFYRSVGMVTRETMKHYIEECQDKYWDIVNEQSTLISFAQTLCA
jgi:putative transposase